MNHAPVDRSIEPTDSRTTRLVVSVVHPPPSPRPPRRRPVLVGLYEEPERPINAVDYVRKYMGAQPGVDVDAVRIENEEMRTKMKDLEKTIEELHQRLARARGESSSSS